jgi:hypothetical protein
MKIWKKICLSTALVAILATASYLETSLASDKNLPPAHGGPPPFEIFEKLPM